MKTMKGLFLAVAVGLAGVFGAGVLAGCASTQASAPVALNFSESDFVEIGSDLASTLVSDAAFATLGNGKRKVVAIGHIEKPATLNIDTDRITRKITQKMKNSGKFILTSAISANGARDSMTRDVRKLRDDDEVNQETIAQKETILAPNYSLAGKITQNVVRMSDGSAYSEYVFALFVTDLTTGLVFWEDEKVVKKAAQRVKVAF